MLDFKVQISPAKSDSIGSFMVDTMADKNAAQFDIRELFAGLADIKDVTLGFERWHAKRKNCRPWRLGA